LADLFIARVAEDLVKQAENDAGKREGLTSEERTELRRLRRDMRVRLEARDPKRATAFVARRADRVKVLPLHRDETGAPSDLAPLPGARRLTLPASSWEYLSPSKAALADGWLSEQIRALHPAPMRRLRRAAPVAGKVEEHPTTPKVHPCRDTDMFLRAHRDDRH
jgi:hypothetical protein